MDQYFILQHSYQVGVLRYDNVCCTVHSYSLIYVICFGLGCGELFCSVWFASRVVY